MRQSSIQNVNIISSDLLPPPAKIIGMLPLTEKAFETISNSREVIERILDRKDKRIFVVIGPCSIHDIRAAKEYAAKLSSLAKEVSDTFFIIMRAYFEKPRTHIGWKGFINDPRLDDSFHIDEGLYKAREFLLHLAELGLPAGKEALDPITPQYLADLISWYAIGARTSESQTHREIASGLSTPVGFKNGTDGDIQLAINALRSVSHEHHFLGITQEGQCAVFHTRGNRYGHVVLRGGGKPNYDRESIANCESQLNAAGLAENIMVDCSHGNSGKDPNKQPEVFRDCIRQIAEGNRSIVGFMLESHLFEGRQDLLSDNLSKLRYGVSITDACIGWEQTVQLLSEGRDMLRGVLAKR